MAKSKKNEIAEIENEVENDSKAIQMNEKLQRLYDIRQMGKDIIPATKKLLTLKRCVASLKIKKVMEEDMDFLDEIDKFADDKLSKMEESINV